MEWNKGLHALEEDTPERDQLVSQLFTLNEIESLPITVEGVREYIANKMKYLTSLCEAWTTGNEHEIKKSEEKLKDDPSRYAKMITERDTVMAKGIHEALQLAGENENPLFAVGSTHLVGSGENVVAQLVKKGWIIERV